MYEVWCSHCNSPHLNGSLPKDALSKNIKAGKSVWLKDCVIDGETMYEKAAVISRCGTVATIRTIEERLRVVDIDPDEPKMQELLPSNDDVVEDMTSLHFTHEPAILENLEIRALNQLPYTFIGNVLVSINPIQKVPEPNEFDDSPHPRTVAERSFHRMTFAMSQYQRDKEKITGLKKKAKASGGTDEEANKLLKQLNPEYDKGDKDLSQNVNQTILISGESGSGKTEAAKRVLIHLVEREEYRDYVLNEHPELYHLQDRLLGSDPILESFGNAKTQKNRNSSRFGKFLKLFYEAEEEYPDSLILSGSSITTYLLERSRVTFQVKGERNFRVFYQLLTANSQAMHRKLGFPTSQYTFRYLGNKKIHKKDLDKTGYLELRTALRMAQLSVRNLVLFEVVAAVLHIGNITFTAENTREGDVALIQGSNLDSVKADSNTKSRPRVADTDEVYSPVDTVIKLLQVDGDLLRSLLCERYVKVGLDKMKKRHDVKTSIRVRDAIAKHVYSLLFDWVVKELNKNMQGDMFENHDDNVCFIGILDIFGFESFARNGFEQLLINYANEILLSLFTQQVLIGESDIYRREGLIMEDKEFENVTTSDVDSNSCLTLFHGEKKQPGLFQVLDSQGQVPAPNENKFLQVLNSKLKSSAALLKPHASERNTAFIIKHYAREVKYSIGHFLEKNDDSLPKEVEQLFESSKHRIVSQFVQLKQGASDGKGGQGKSKNFLSSVKKQRKNRTVAASFKQNINSLSETLNRTGCHYIRCIKPNPTLFFGLNEGGMSSMANADRLVSNQESDGRSVLSRRNRRLRDKKKRQSYGFTKVGQLALAYDAPTDQPNANLTYFDRAFVSRQLRTLGVYNAVKVLKSGLPTRIPYQSIITSFKEFIPKEAMAFYENKQVANKEKLILSALLWAFKVPEDSYRLGHTRIFFGNGELDNMKEILNSAVRWKNFPKSREKKRIVQRFRRFYSLQLWRKALIKVVAINHFLRILRRSQAARTIQRCVRAYWLRVRRHRLELHASVVLQTAWRGWAARRLLEQMRIDHAEQMKLAEEERLRLQAEQRAAQKEEVKRLARQEEERRAEEERIAEEKRLAELAAKPVEPNNALREILEKYYDKNLSKEKKSKSFDERALEDWSQTEEAKMLESQVFRDTDSDSQSHSSMDYRATDDIHITEDELQELASGPVSKYHISDRELARLEEEHGASVKLEKMSEESKSQPSNSKEDTSKKVESTTAKLRESVRSTPSVVSAKSKSGKSVAQKHAMVRQTSSLGHGLYAALTTVATSPRRIAKSITETARHSRKRHPKEKEIDAEDEDFQL